MREEISKSVCVYACEGREGEGSETSNDIPPAPLPYLGILG